MSEKKVTVLKKSIVELKEVNKIFGANHVVKDLNLTVEEGEFLTLLGSSGCGKTTTLRMIAGFEEPSSGTIQVEGEAIEEKEPYERNVNTVFQSYALFPHMTIYDNIAYGLKMKKVSKTEIAERVKSMMELVQLEGFEKRYPNQLSGGQKQRVAIARALINRPRVLLLDEPLGALDLKLRKQMQLELKRLQRKMNITFIYVTHDQEEALTMSDRIGVMHEGIMDQIGTPSEIYEHPATKFVATFIGETNIFEGYVTEIRKTGAENSSTIQVAVENGEIIGSGEGFQEKEFLTISVRPEKMKYSMTPVEDFTLSAQVKDFIYVGSIIKCIIVLPNGSEIKVERLAGEELPAVGTTVYPYWKKEDAVLIHSMDHIVFNAVDDAELV